MMFPSHQHQECPPFGSKDIRFLISDDEEEDEEYDVPVLSEADAQTTAMFVHENWGAIWSEVLPRVEALLVEYKYSGTLADILADQSNWIQVVLAAPDEDAKNPISVEINIGSEHSSIVYGVEFDGLKPIGPIVVF